MRACSPSLPYKSSVFEKHSLSPQVVHPLPEPGHNNTSTGSSDSQVKLGRSTFRIGIKCASKSTNPPEGETKVTEAIGE